MAMMLQRSWANGAAVPRLVCETFMFRGGLGIPWVFPVLPLRLDWGPANGMTFIS